MLQVIFQWPQVPLTRPPSKCVCVSAAATGRRCVKVLCPIWPLTSRRTSQGFAGFAYFSIRKYSLMHFIWQSKNVWHWHCHRHRDWDWGCPPTEISLCWLTTQSRRSFRSCLAYPGRRLKGESFSKSHFERQPKEHTSRQALNLHRIYNKKWRVPSHF